MGNAERRIVARAAGTAWMGAIRAGDQRLVVYSPACETDTSAKLAQLLDDEREPDLAPIAG